MEPGTPGDVLADRAHEECRPVDFKNTVLRARVSSAVPMGPGVRRKAGPWTRLLPAASIARNSGAHPFSNCRPMLQNLTACCWMILQSNEQSLETRCMIDLHIDLGPLLRLLKPLRCLISTTSLCACPLPFPHPPFVSARTGLNSRTVEQTSTRSIRSDSMEPSSSGEELTVHLCTPCANSIQCCACTSSSGSSCTSSSPAFTSECSCRKISRYCHQTARHFPPTATCRRFQQKIT